MNDRRTRFCRDLHRWGKDNLREFPWRDEDATTYEIFVAEFLLIQTQAEQVAEILPEFMEEFPSMEDVEVASESDIADVLKPLGLQHRRAHALKAIAERVDGDIPTDVEAMRELPMVGQYVSNATAMYAFGENHPLLDTNIRRVYGRLLGDEWPSDESEQLQLASEMIERSVEGAQRYNLTLLDFGALVCRSGSPRCDQCFARTYCEYAKADLSE